MKAATPAGSCEKITHSELIKQNINAHEEIYSLALNCKVACLIGHPGSGKTMYCNKLINEFASQENETYRFVFDALLC